MASKIMPRNLMEELVDSELDKYLQETDICRCARCRADVLAMALNRLPAKYVVSISGDVFSRFDTMKTQFQVDITAAILLAIETVKKNAYHSDTQDHALLLD